MHNSSVQIYTRDAALWLFACIALACFVVSAPATYTLVGLFHNDGTVYGMAATVLFLLVLEAGAVASKVATLFVRQGRGGLHLFCISALSVNAVSNLIHGAQVAERQGVSGASLWIGSVAYALSVPAILYLMLALFCRRIEALRGKAGDLQEQVQDAMAPVLAMQAQYTLLVQAMQTMQAAHVHAPALAAPADTTPVSLSEGTSGAEAAEPMPVCLKCGTAVESVKARAASARWGCKRCKV